MAERRRGAALEKALLDAAWDELAEHGYARFTVDAVVRRAAPVPRCSTAAGPTATSWSARPSPTCSKSHCWSSPTRAACGTTW
ncbi:TetR/AcrR family transcriptional regulator [Actinomadura madurae]|uniref:TetR/AcrR family transcriptional regulator n=1 Tax=Actinomadura madurae TaxID=1993 RepID=UPI003558F39A